jgi:hypothetical protein
LYCGIVGFGPRPFRTRPNLTRPSAANLSRHAATVAGLTPTCSPIRYLATPSAANSNAFARCTSRTGADRDRDNTVSVPR